MSPMLSLSGIFTALGHPDCCSFPPPFLWCVSDVYIYIYTYVNVQGKTMPLHFRVPHPYLIKPATLLQRGLPFEDHHDSILSMKRRRITLDGGFIDLHVPG
jgi:hypothetical protein